MIIHKIPPGISKEEFESKFEPLVDEAVQLPVVKKNLTKVELVRISFLIYSLAR
jgi:hypothetical protein